MLIRFNLVLGLAVSVGLQSQASAQPTTTLVLAPTAANPRNSEGSFISLKDGRIFFVYSHFTGGARDDDKAFLAGRFSNDQGRTWTTSDITVVPENASGLNTMSVSLLRLRDGRIALFWMQKRAVDDCRPVMRVSIDEAKSWDEPIQIIPDVQQGYYVLNNDRVVQLRSGRLIVPVSLHRPAGEKWNASGTIICYLSDDGGKRWRRSQSVMSEPASMQEPGVIELKDGRLLMYCRTLLGSQYLSYSRDQGETWGTPQPSDIRSPQSPASIKRILKTGDLLLIWNDNFEKGKPGAGRRTPLCSAISRDEGKTWANRKVLEDNPHGWFCYTAIEFINDDVLLGYCGGDTRQNNGLALTKVVRVPFSWFYGGAAASHSAE